MSKASAKNEKALRNVRLKDIFNGTAIMVPVRSYLAAMRITKKQSFVNMKIKALSVEFI